MVFEVANAPTSQKEFMTWHLRQVEWAAAHNCAIVDVASPALRNWFMEMKDIFPPLNGEFAPDDDALAENPDLEERMADYLIGRDIIYAEFAWPLALEAQATMLYLAQKHQVGLFDPSADDGGILLPDGTTMA